MKIIKNTNFQNIQILIAQYGMRCNSNETSPRKGKVLMLNATYAHILSLMSIWRHFSHLLEYKFWLLKHLNWLSKHNSHNMHPVLLSHLKITLGAMNSAKSEYTLYHNFQFGWCTISLLMLLAYVGNTSNWKILWSIQIDLFQQNFTQKLANWILCGLYFYYHTTTL